MLYKYNRVSRIYYFLSAPIRFYLCKSLFNYYFLHATAGRGGQNMTDRTVIDMLYTAFVTALKLAAPLLLASMGIGLIVSIFQAATQINEQTLSFVPKLILIGVLLVLLAPWMMTVMKEFIYQHFVTLLSYM